MVTHIICYGTGKVNKHGTLGIRRPLVRGLFSIPRGKLQGGRIPLGSIISYRPPPPRPPPPPAPRLSLHHHPTPPRMPKPHTLNVRPHPPNDGPWTPGPGVHCTNSRSGPRTSPKFVKIIPDTLNERMAAGINKPFTQNPNSYLFQD